MLLKVVIEEQTFSLPIEDSLVQQAESFFNKMDEDMDKGWQMGREWVEKPSHQQRLTIAADKLLTALENDDKKLGKMMAGYICSRAPNVTMIEMDVTGEMGHDFHEQKLQTPEPATSSEAASAANSASRQSPPLSKMEALQQAGNEVSRVFKSGKQYKFSMLNPASGQWEESPAIADKEEAENMREFAVKKRFDQLLG
jgi:hypothetical protein